MWGVFEFVSGVPARRRARVWHHLPRSNRQRADTAPEGTGVQSPIVRFVFVRGMYQRMSGEDRPASTPAAEPAKRDAQGSKLNAAALGVQAVAVDDDERESLPVAGPGWPVTTANRFRDAGRGNRIEPSEVLDGVSRVSGRTEEVVS